MHPKLYDWLQDDVTRLLFRILQQKKSEFTDAVINSDGVYSEPGLKHIVKLIGQIQLIDELSASEEFFPSELLDTIGEE